MGWKRVVPPAALMAVNTALLNPWGLAASLVSLLLGLWVKTPRWLYYLVTLLAAAATVLTPNLEVLKWFAL